MNPEESTDSEKLLLRRIHHLTDSLASMRVANKADVVLVCEGKEFYAHKCVLEASSEYFVTMLNSGLQESRTGTIVFKEMAPETLDAVLDFLYLGKVDKIQTELQLKTVLKTAHMMQIQDLFLYCYNTWASKVTTENFFELFVLGKKYELDSLGFLVKFWAANKQVLLHSNQFLLLSFTEVANLVQFLTGHGMWLGAVLQRLCSWVQHDFDNRSKFAAPLLPYIDFTLVSKQGVEDLLRSQIFKQMPSDFTAKFKELSITTFLSGLDVCPHNPTGVQMPLHATRLTFFSTNRNVEVFYPSKNCSSVARSVNWNGFQQLDLKSMSWLSSFSIRQDFCVRPVFNCKHKWYISNASGVQVYDSQRCTYESSKLEGKDGRSICYFRDHIYAIGGCTTVTGGFNVSKQNISQVFYSKFDSDQWSAGSYLPFTADSIAIFTSQYYIYVLDVNQNYGEMRIQYNSSPDKISPWHGIYISTEGVLTPNNFFIFENTLQALYLFSEQTVHLRYSHGEKVMKAETFCKPPDGVKQITRVCTHAVDPVIYVSTKNDTFRIPDFIWDHKTGKWTALPIPTGKREIPSATNSFEVMF